ncbi:hypothetical protein AOLI_G00174940 [Acnodon oligacanthus]
MKPRQRCDVLRGKLAVDFTLEMMERNFTGDVCAVPEVTVFLRSFCISDFFFFFLPPASPKLKGSGRNLTLACHRQSRDADQIGLGQQMNKVFLDRGEGAFLRPAAVK